MATLKVNAITPSSGTALTITAATASISGTLTVPNITGTASLATNATNAANLSTVISGLPVVATGSSTAIPVITVSNKGLTTILTTAAVVAPAGTLSGTALPAAVVGSSLTSVGTLTGLTLGTTAVLTSNNTTDSSSYATGSVIIKGGLGVDKNGYIKILYTDNLQLYNTVCNSDGLTRVINYGYQGYSYTQLTSKATAVAVTSSSGIITLFATSMLAGQVYSFNITHPFGIIAIAQISTKSGGTVGAYSYSSTSASTTATTISIRNATAGTLAESPIIYYSMVFAP